MGEEMREAKAKLYSLLHKKPHEDMADSEICILYELARDGDIQEILKEAQQVPVVKIKESRIKPERMGYMEKGAKFGKSRCGPEVNEAFIQKWKKRMEDYWPDKQTVDARHLKGMLEEVGVTIKKEENK